MIVDCISVCLTFLNTVIMSKNKYKSYHKKGQQDASKGKYSTPHSSWSDSSNDKIRSENKSYKKGWSSTNNQKKNSSSGK